MLFSHFRAQKLLYLSQVRRTRTNGLDIESTISYTESPDEATYKGIRGLVLYLSRSSGLVSEVSPGGADSAACRTTATQAAETVDEQV